MRVVRVEEGRGFFKSSGKLFLSSSSVAKWLDHLPFTTKVAGSH